MWPTCGVISMSNQNINFVERFTLTKFQLVLWVTRRRREVCLAEISGLLSHDALINSLSTAWSVTNLWMVFEWLGFKLTLLKIHWRQVNKSNSCLIGESLYMYCICLCVCILQYLIEKNAIKIRNSIDSCSECKHRHVSEVLSFVFFPTILSSLLLNLSWPNKPLNLAHFSLPFAPHLLLCIFFIINAVLGFLRFCFISVPHFSVYSLCLRGEKITVWRV